MNGLIAECLIMRPNTNEATYPVTAHGLLQFMMRAGKNQYYFHGGENMNKSKMLRRLVISCFTLLFFFSVSSAVFAGGGKEEKRSTDIMEAVEQEGSILHIIDWAEWWPQEIYDGFSEEYCIEIVRDNFMGVAELVTKLKLNPNIDYDITLPEIRGLIQMIELGLLLELNHDWLPNAEKYLPEFTKNAFYDPGYKYSIATDLGFLAQVYNSDYIDENDPGLGSWQKFFENAHRYSGKITMQENMFQVIGTALLSLGYSFNSVDEGELMEARDLLFKTKPYLMSFDDWPKRVLIEGEAWTSVLWMGTAWFLSQENDAIKGALDPEGTLIEIDSLVIPKGAKHPAAAHLFMDYVLRPEINALLISTIAFAPNHTETAKLLSEEMKKYPGVIVSEEYMEKCEFTRPEIFTGKGLELREKIWEELRQ